MEPVTAIATALALGATSALKGTAESAVKDAYAALKRVIVDRYARRSVDALEEKPDSKARLAAVEEDLESNGAASDPEAIALMKALLDAIARHDPGAGAVLGVDVRNIEAQSLTIEAVRSSGSGVRVDGARVSGSIHIGGVEAGPEGGAPKKA